MEELSFMFIGNTVFRDSPCQLKIRPKKRCFENKKSMAEMNEAKYF
jgi:hypothetical protein